MPIMDYTLFFGIKAASPINTPAEQNAFLAFKAEFNLAMRKRANCDAGINVTIALGAGVTAGVAAAKTLFSSTFAGSTNTALDAITLFTPIITTVISGVLKLYKDVVDSSGMKQLQGLAVTGMRRGYFDDNARVQTMIDGLSGVLPAPPAPLPPTCWHARCDNAVHAAWSGPRQASFFAASQDLLAEEGALHHNAHDPTGRVTPTP
ncbi:MAG: hypothetical protein A2X78_01895 [Gammaproteobacteria bacterium GWE2_37_16]|nr:MAG: hypothetical protein A2X78_01895 [Gammaproteobacteria bacterium GWE2_37_16]